MNRFVRGPRSFKAVLSTDKKYNSVINIKAQNTIFKFQLKIENANRIPHVPFKIMKNTSNPHILIFTNTNVAYSQSRKGLRGTNQKAAPSRGSFSSMHFGHLQITH